MSRSPDTDLRAYSGRALLVAAAVSSSLHVLLALAVPEWGGGGGLPLLRRPPRVVRLEMLRETQKSEVRSQKSETRSEPANLQERPGGRGQEKKNQGVRNEDRGARVPPSSLIPQSLSPDPRSSIPNPDIGFSLADGEEEGLFLAAQGGEGADSLAWAGGDGNGQKGEGPEGADFDGAGALEMWQVEAPPKQVAFVEPEYPSQARRMGVEGSVVVRYLVDQSGQVEQMIVLEGPELLREASLHAVGRFVYEPVRHRGRAVKVWMRQVITFRLE